MVTHTAKHSDGLTTLFSFQGFLFNHPLSLHLLDHESHEWTNDTN
jgi:hypothetical protein